MREITAKNLSGLLLIYPETFKRYRVSDSNNLIGSYCVTHTPQDGSEYTYIFDKQRLDRLFTYDFDGSYYYNVRVRNNDDVDQI